VRIANTHGVADIHIGDRFREQGFGPGAEELEVAGVNISQVGGASQLFFNRAANATKPEVHRLGAVFNQVGIKVGAAVDPAYQPLRETVGVTDATNFTAPPAYSVSEEVVPPKRGRGRPPGSKNRPKAEVAFPTGF
jgi:hypothetical protein